MDAVGLIVNIDRRRFMKRVVALSASAAAVLVGVFGYLLPSKRRVEVVEYSVLKVVALPQSVKKGSLSVEEALMRRRSIRDYAQEPLSLTEVSQLLWSAQGITESTYGFRTAPSAGGTYPLEVYVAVKKGGVEGLEEGVYHYDPFKNLLEMKVKGDFSEALMAAAVAQRWVADAMINIVLTAVFERTTRRYGERGVHYVYMEAGHVGENIYLQAVALGLGTVVIGAFYDEEVQRILGFSREEKPLYIIPVGRTRVS